MKNLVPEAIHDQRNCVRYLDELKDLSRRNRKNPTEAEKKIWEEVLRNKKTGYLFLRQKPIGRFILDFYCSKVNLAIEIDGNSHDQKKGRDELRDKYLKQIGIKTLRFTNDQVQKEIEKVKEIIIESLPCQREI